MSALSGRFDLEAKVVWLDAPRNLVFRRESLARPEADELVCKTLVTAIANELLDNF